MAVIAVHGFLVWVGGVACSPSCSRAVTTFADVSKALGNVSTLLVNLLSLTDQHGRVLVQAYADLGVANQQTGFGAVEIQRMERRLADLRSDQEKIREALKTSRTGASDYFDLLIKRTEQNQTLELKEPLLQELSEKQSVFNARFEKVENQLDIASQGIQKYDDILGYVQVKSGLGALNDRLTEIDRLIEDTRELNAGIHQAIQESLDIVRQLAQPEPHSGQSSNHTEAVKSNISSTAAAPPSSERYLQLFSTPSGDEAEARAKRQAFDIGIRVCVYASNGVFGTAIGPLDQGTAEELLQRVSRARYPSVASDLFLARGTSYVERRCFVPDSASGGSY